MDITFARMGSREMNHRIDGEFIMTQSEKLNSTLKRNENNVEFSRSGLYFHKNIGY